MEETLQNPGKGLWKQVSMIQTLYVTFSSVQSDAAVFKNMHAKFKIPNPWALTSNTPKVTK